MTAADLGFEHVFRPPANPQEPTLLLLHGTGGTEHDLIPLAESLAQGAALISPRGKVLERDMPRFFRRLAEGVFDLDDLRFRTHELAGFVAAAAARYGFDAKKVVAVGFSNGANIAASTLLLEPGVLAGAILFRAMVPIVRSPAPRSTARRCSCPTGGRLLDPCGRSRAPRILLRQAGADLTIEWQPAATSYTAGSRPR